MGTKLCDEDRIEAVSEMMVPFQIESEECQFGDGGAGDSHLGIELRIVGTMGAARKFLRLRRAGTRGPRSSAQT